MAIDQPNPPQSENRLRAHLLGVRAAGRRANSAWRRALRLVQWLFLSVILVFGALVLSLNYLFLPRIDQYKGHIERIATSALGRSVSIARIEAAWDGIHPRLALDDVVVHDLDGRVALRLPSVAAAISWRSLTIGDLRLASLEINRPDLDMRLEADGKLYIAGILIDTQKKEGSKAADWIFKQDEIVIREGRLRWTDNRRGAPELLLEQVDFTLQNSWRHHRLRLRASPPATHAGPIDVQADFVHSVFAERIADVARWKGNLFVDLQNTDLAAWKPYLDYPIEIQQGEGSVRAWMVFDHAKIADFAADVKLSHVVTRLERGLPLLRLAQVSGRISAREDFEPSEAEDERSFGERAHAIALNEFSLQTADGLVLPQTTITETYVPGRNNVPGKTELRTRLLDLTALASLAQYLPLSKDQRQMLADFSPGGQLTDFSVQWQGSYPDLVSYAVNGQFSDLSMKAQPPRPARPKEGTKPAQAAVPGIPGFENLTGSVTADERGGKVSLDSDKATLQLPGYFSEAALPFEQLQMQANWKLDKDQLQFQIEKMNFVQDGIAGSVSGRHVKPMAQQGQPAGTVDMSAKVARFDVKKIGRYLPLQTPEGLRRWLGGALEEGFARDVVIRIKGDLEHFPFKPDRPGGKPKGEFSVNAKIDNGTLNYTPGRFANDGKSPLWPQAEKIQGYLTIDNARIVIHADTAMTGGVALSNVEAVIPDMLASDRQLEIVGNAEGALQDFVRYTTVTPVAGWIGNLTEDTKATGNAKLLLKMQMPLERMPDSKVQGTLQFLDNDVTLLKDLPTLLNTSGKLEFWEKGFRLSGMNAQFLGGGATLSGGTQQNGKFQVKAGGSVTPDGLRKAYPNPAMQHLAGRMNGSARFSVEVNQEGAKPDVIVESNLRGLALDFPAPLGKSANQNLPLRVHLTSQPSPGRSIARDEMRLSLGPAMAAHYLRQKDGKDGAWRVMRGGIGVNMPPSGPAEGLALNVNLHSLDLDAWGEVMESFSGNSGKGPSDNQASTDALNVTQYIQPKFFNARADNLSVMGTKLDHAQVTATRQSGGWQAQVESEQVTGQVAWTDPVARSETGKLSARLTALNIPKSVMFDVPGLFGGQKGAPRIPALDIVAHNFVLLGKRLGRIELVASNTPAVVGREWRIDRLQISNPDATLKASGDWTTTRAGQHATTLNYTLDVADAGKLLARFGYANVLRRGKGKMEGGINWQGLPFSIDYSSLSGKIKLDMEAGQFLQVEPGAAKLLGVLNLQALPRRLMLDFRDVFSQGFSFDGITAAATITNGIAQTDNLKMRGVNATVLMDGVADIAKETQNLHIVVLPEINAGAASIVYGLAVNPVIGLGTFLAQLFLRDPLMRAFTFEYQVTGPWAEPTVTKLPRNTGYTKEAPSP